MSMDVQKATVLQNDLSKTANAGQLQSAQQRAAEYQHTEENNNINIPAIVLLILCCLLGYLAFAYSNDAYHLKTQLNEASSRITFLEGNNDELYTRLTDLQFSFAWNHDQPEAALITSGEDEDLLIFKKYVVQSGDTLKKICHASNVNYIKNKDVIKKINHIQNENMIFSGQSLLLPVQ